MLFFQKENKDTINEVLAKLEAIANALSKDKLPKEKTSVFIVAKYIVDTAKNRRSLQPPHLVPRRSQSVPAVTMLLKRSWEITRGCLSLIKITYCPE